MELIEQIALTLCGYELPGEPCEAACEWCKGQAEAVMKVVRGEYENWLNKENGTETIGMASGQS
jgi:hypothetical protein